MHIYHITDRSSWLTAKMGSYYKADTLESDGFIHCCTSEQVAFVLKNWFKGAKDLVMLVIDTDKLTSPVKNENLEGGDELFPHIYGRINLDAVINDTKLVGEEN